MTNDYQKEARFQDSVKVVGPSLVYANCSKFVVEYDEKTEDILFWNCNDNFDSPELRIPLCQIKMFLHNLADFLLTGFSNELVKVEVNYQGPTLPYSCDRDKVKVAEIAYDTLIAITNSDKSISIYPMKNGKSIESSAVKFTVPVKESDKLASLQTLYEAIRMIRNIPQL